MSEPVLLFDGVCNLCNGCVNFLLDREHTPRLRFAAMQSSAGQALLQEHGLPLTDYKSMALIEDGKLWQKSDAALQLLNYLRQPWPWLRIFRLVPRFIRDGVYDLIAQNRYRLFGQQNQCRVPDPALRQRFL